MKTIMACVCVAAVMYLAGSCSDNVPVVNPKPVMPSADIVLGMVHSGDIMLEDVIVTDGYNFTRTDRNGQFVLRLSENAEYVYVVSPSGYVCDYSSGAPEFYRKASSKTFDFDLLPVQSAEDYSLVVMADPQTKNDEQFGKFCAAPLADLSSVCKARAAERFTAGICLGDVVQDAMELLPEYKSMMKETGVPFYAVIGNHDYNAKSSGEKAAEDFKKVFGPLNYAFYIGRDIVVGLNTVIYNGNKKFDEGYPPEAIGFLRGLMELVPDDVHVYVAQHIPFHRWYEKDPIRGGGQVLEILAGHEVDFITGHTHVHNTLTLGENMIDHNISGFLGAWWVADYCRDGTPRGYKIFDRRDGNLSWIFRSVEFGDGPMSQAEIVRPGQSEAHTEAVLLNVWDMDEKWTVMWHQGSSAKAPMTRVNDYSPVFIKNINEAFPDGNIPSYSTPSNSRHFFSAVPDPAAGPVKIELTNRFGIKWDYEIPVVK